MANQDILSFYRNKKVLVTGHTGFKGSWMCALLKQAGADVTGYALEAPSGSGESPQPVSLFDLCRIRQGMRSITGDIRDLGKLSEVFGQVRPEIVIHMAAQPIVRESYVRPVYTYEVNVMGTVNVLECIRCTDSVRSFVNVTTDKVYKNREWEWGYRECEELNGFDPYSNSKSCSELVTDSYKNAFFQEEGYRTAISTARAGNVVGGGDFAADRIIPDCVRAMENGTPIVVRNPHSVRPYQHVLEPVFAYLMIAARQYGNREYEGCYNVGPEEADCYTTGELTELFCREWERQSGQEVTWVNRYDGGPHEAGFLKLDCSKIKRVFGWKPVWNLEHAMKQIVDWSLCYLQGGDTEACMNRQIREFTEGIE